MADYRPRARSWERVCPFCGRHYTVSNLSKRHVRAGDVVLEDVHQVACFRAKQGGKRDGH
jgi:hypothetical protein